MLKFTNKQMKLIEAIWISNRKVSINDLLNQGYGLRLVHFVVESLLSAHILWNTSNEKEFELNPNVTEAHIYQFLGINLDIEKRVSLQHLDKDHTEYVYMYYYPTYKSHALLNEIPTYPCKVGSTTRALPLLRCVEQFNTSTPETPVVALLIKCNNAERIERALHAYLKANNRHLKHFFNQEWFMTNTFEIEHILANIHLTTN